MTAVGSALGPVQAAIVALLAADSTLRTLAPGGVLDVVPESTVVNYVAIGEWTEAADDTLEDGAAGRGSSCTVTIHTITDDTRGAAGFKSAQAINSRVVALLHAVSLTVTGYTSVLCELEGTNGFRDESEEGRMIRHLVSTFRIDVEAT